MKKTLDFLFGGRKIYIIINAVFAAALAVFIVFDVTFLDFWLFIADVSSFLCGILIYYSGLALPYLIIVNIIAFLAVKKGSKWGIVFSLLFGFIGSFIAVHSMKKDYFGAKAIKIIFNIYYWIIGVIPFFPFFSYSIAEVEVYCTFAVFFAVMFLMFVGISRVVPTEKLITANLLVNAVLSASAAVIFNPYYFGVYDAVYEISSYANFIEGYSYYKSIIAALVLVIFLIAYAPNYILYSKYRTGKKESYSFKTHLKKTAAAFLCNLSVVYIICFILFSYMIIIYFSYD
ncbi:MAG: hypothetical protein K2J76_04465 [Oscillospiraceae bacterium]|nr:hypothetical protein [Oscillospiraceae bacterium]